MLRGRRSPTFVHSLMALLVMLLLLGHVCELAPAVEAAVASHAAHDHHHDHHHQPGGDAGESRLGCDAVDGLPKGPLTTAPAPAVTGWAPVHAVAPARPATAFPTESARRPPGPPLFLLHASLLI